MSLSESLSEAWRKECLVRDDMEFLNAGTLGSTLRSAFQSTQDSMLKWLTEGPGGSLQNRSARMYLNMMEEQDRCREAVAQWMGVEKASVALLGNATDGINAALGSIPWQAGNRIITSDEEHEALQRPLAQLAHRYGVIIDMIPFPRTNEEVSDFLEKLRHTLVPSTKLVAVSHVSHVTGIRLPLAELAKALESTPEVWLLADGSHAAGTTVNFLNPRVDFYMFPGHKWLFGPIETGILWVSRRVLQETTPLLSGAPMMSADGIRYERDDGAWRFEYGTRDWSKMVGLKEAVRFRQQWPEAVLIEHYQALGHAFIKGFVDECSLIIVGAAPLYSVSVLDSDTVASVLWEENRVLVKPQTGNIRISLPPWLDSQRSIELGRLVGRAVTRIQRQSLL